MKKLIIGFICIFIAKDILSSQSTDKYCKNFTAMTKNYIKKNAHIDENTILKMIGMAQTCKNFKLEQKLKDLYHDNSGERRGCVHPAFKNLYSYHKNN